LLQKDWEKTAVNHPNIILTWETSLFIICFAENK
jgi:hypothetical protein